MEAVDQALALCSEDGGPPHVKLVLEWTSETKASIIADDNDLVEEHSSVKMLRAQALHGKRIKKFFSWNLIQMHHSVQVVLL